MGRVEAEVRLHDSALHLGDQGAVPDLQSKGAGVLDVHVCYLVEGRFGAVVGHPQAIENAGVGAAGADLVEVVGESVEAVLHPLLRLNPDVVDHVSTPCS
jgi:hypothetical protein